ncbi:MAG TPA: hypothetical protein VEU47_19405 [Candidatus Cybelea sp.]|nr:hypothetical protein [Candidatus Cybelea sp.]
MNSFVAILFDDLGPDAGPDAADTIVQVETVEAALRELGYLSRRIPVSLDLAATKEALLRLDPAFAFNLVESLAGQGRLIHLVPALLDAIGLAYTGCDTQAFFTTNAKPLAKRLLAADEIATPLWADSAGASPGPGTWRGPWIVKSVYEHASIGLDADAVVQDWAALPDLLARRRRDHGGAWFVEQFVDGREFNVGLLADGTGPEVLPIAEMTFVDFPPGKPRIIDYKAKWQEESFEFRNTVRRFDLPETDRAVLAAMTDIALRCWRLFALRGYARVDFRVDGQGKPWVLEVNANPCLSPDAGFAAAAKRRGLSPVDFVRRIIADLNRPPRPRKP